MTKSDIVLAIDPGNIESAWCRLGGDMIIFGFGKVKNAELFQHIEDNPPSGHIACEMIASYGMPVGASVFETCLMIGRLQRASVAPVTLITRQQVKLHVCKSPRANDANIRAALIDLFGPQGKKSAPGPTYGISADCWAALAVAETYRSGDFEPYILSQDKT